MERRPRVLRVVTGLGVGGTARQVLSLTRGLTARGFDTRLAWGPPGSGEAELSPPDDCPSTNLPWLGRAFDPVGDVRTLHALQGIMRRWRPQVVHTHRAKAGVLGRSAAPAGVPVVVHTFDARIGPESFSGLRGAASVAAERRLAARTDALIAVAPCVRDDLLALGIGRGDQWHVVPVGVDVAILLSNRPSRDEARARLDLPLDGSAIGVVGRLAPIKDHRTFFEAAARVVAERPDTTIVVAGEGELRSRLESEARAILGDRVRFLGWVRDLPALYGALDIVALTSRLEGTPVSLIEAAASGTPAVATAVGGVAEVVRDRQTGLLVPPRDPVAVAAQLLTLLDDPEGARRMGEEGARWVTKRFSEQRLSDDIAELYDELISRARATRGSGTLSRLANG